MPCHNASEPVPITRIQALYFELIRTIQYNNLDGARVVGHLLDWRDLWHSVTADRLPTPRFQKTRDYQYDVFPPLSFLHTTRFDYWPADTLYLWTDEDRLPRLERLIKEHWHADVIELVDQDDVKFMLSGRYEPEDRVLMVWWD